MKPFLQKFFLNSTFYVLFFALTPVLVSVLSLAVVVRAPFISHRRAMCHFRQLIKVYGKIIISFARPLVRVQYEESAPLPDAPRLYVCNHRSASDPFLMAFPPGEIVQWVNTWPFRLPILGPFARWAGYLSVRAMPSEEALARSARLLEQGVSIAAFPEGTRSASRVMGPFHGLIFRLALQTGAPIVPICISGNENIPHKGSIALNPGTIRIKTLPALTQSDYRSFAPFKLKTLVHEQISAELKRMEAAE
ncbi:MAG: 1-acyl-sn-glycerol-3-phosphate acyltransferase [Pontiellaceae bacterium]|nr:1-acyl-sn-glycerol-3-phosphate acyltransferase [Pontiellaceae bacterium]